MTPLRQRLIEEIGLRDCSRKTREAYVRAVACLAHYSGRTPDQLRDEELRAWLMTVYGAGLRFNEACRRTCLVGRARVGCSA